MVTVYLSSKRDYKKHDIQLIDGVHIIKRHSECHCMFYFSNDRDALTKQ